MGPLPLLHAGDSVLLVLDMQTRIGAALPPAAWAQARASTRALAQAADALALPVIATRQEPAAGGDPGGDPGGDIEPEISRALPAHAVRLDKAGFDATRDESLREALAMTGRTQVAVCGTESHVSVVQTVAGLAALGFAPFVVADAIAARRQADDESARARLRSAGVPLLPCESALCEWLGDTRHPVYESLAVART